MLRLALALLLGMTALAWADPADDLRACQNSKMAYLSKLGETVAEMKEQRDQAQAHAQALRDALGIPAMLPPDMAIRQAQSMAQELQRLKAPKPEEKK